MNLKPLRIENDYTQCSQWDVAQRSFSKYTVKQMSFESGFNVSAHLISSGSWFINFSSFVWTLGISNWLDPTDLSGLLGLYSVNTSAMYLGPSYWVIYKRVKVL